MRASPRQLDTIIPTKTVETKAPKWQPPRRAPTNSPQPGSIRATMKPPMPPEESSTPTFPSKVNLFKNPRKQGPEAKLCGPRRPPQRARNDYRSTWKRLDRPTTHTAFPNNEEGTARPHKWDEGVASPTHHIYKQIPGHHHHTL